MRPTGKRPLKATRERAAAAVLAAGAALALSGCYVLSVNPLYEGADTVFDPGLVGTWSPEGTDESWTFVATGGGDYRMIATETNPQDPGESLDGAFIATLVELGGLGYLDLLPDEPEVANDFWKCHIVPGHTFWRIDRQGHVLVLKLLSLDALKAVAERTGVVLDHVERDDVTVLTATPAAMRAVLEAHGEELFPESETMTRVR